MAAESDDGSEDEERAPPKGKKHKRGLKRNESEISDDLPGQVTPKWTITVQRQKARQVIGIVAPLLTPMQNMVTTTFADKKKCRKVSSYFQEQAKTSLKEIEEPLLFLCVGGYDMNTQRLTAQIH